LISLNSTQTTKLSEAIDALIQEAYYPESDWLTEYRSGVYSSVTLDPTALQKIWKYLKQVGLPMQHIKNAHVTVIYSQTRPSSKPQAFEINGSVEPIGFGIFGKGSKKEPYVLVLRFKSQALEQAHQKIQKDLRIKPTYSQFKPHLTLVLDINRLFPGLNRLTEKQKENIMGIMDKMIPDLPKSIRILKHTVEPRV